MNPDFGFATYYPNGQFAFNRSYVKQVIGDFTGGVVSYVAGLMTFFYPLPDPVTELVIFRDYFHPWSSNSYTVDGIVASISYSFASDPLTIYPGGINISWHVTGNPPTPSITITPNTYGGLFTPFPLPAAPPDYWLKI